MNVKPPSSNTNRRPRGAKPRNIVRSPKDLEWLNNGFDEELMRISDERDLQDAVESTPRPKHWKPISTDPVR